MKQLPNKNEDLLKKMLSNDLLEQPSAHFTSDVLGKLGISTATNSIKYEPVISKNGWILIGIIIGSILWFALSNFTSTSEAGFSSLIINQTLSKTNGFIRLFTDDSFVLLISILSIAVFMLVSAESVYRQSRLKAA
ncbi:MAG: hypothetical protein IPP71_17575 [Bacteroidetes bacterium]|nr:hypothetical protein [Bacteroidota bacterium]